MLPPYINCCFTQTLNINKGAKGGWNQQLDSSRLSLFSEEWRTIVREVGDTKHYIINSCQYHKWHTQLEEETRKKNNWFNNISIKWIVCQQRENELQWPADHRRWPMARWLTVCRCRSCGRRSFSWRGVCCWAPGPGSGPRPGAPFLRGSGAALCSWSGCLDRGMRTTLCGSWDKISDLWSRINFSL